MAAIADNGRALLVLGFRAPTFGAYDTFTDFDEIFTTPKLAIVPTDVNSVTSAPIACGNLSLAGSGVFVPGPSGDFDGDEDVDLLDVGAFQRCFTGGLGGIGVGCEMFDFNRDQRVGLVDLVTLIDKIGGP